MNGSNIRKLIMLLAFLVIAGFGSGVPGSEALQGNGGRIGGLY